MFKSRDDAEEKHITNIYQLQTVTHCDFVTFTQF